MEREGVVHNGMIVPDDATALSEGERVRYEVLPSAGAGRKSFAERYAAFKGCLPPDAPTGTSTLAQTVEDDWGVPPPPVPEETRAEFLASLRESVAAAKAGDLGMTVDEAFARLEAESA